MQKAFKIQNKKLSRGKFFRKHSKVRLSVKFRVKARLIRRDYNSEWQRRKRRFCNVQDKIFTLLQLLILLTHLLKKHLVWLIAERNLWGNQEFPVIEFTPLEFSSCRKLFKRKREWKFCLLCFAFSACLKVAEQIALNSGSNVIRREVPRRIRRRSWVSDISVHRRERIYMPIINQGIFCVMPVLSNMHKGKIYILRILRHSKRKSFFLSLGLTLFYRSFCFSFCKSDNIVDVDSEGALDVCLWFVARLNKIILDLIKLSGGFDMWKKEQRTEKFLWSDENRDKSHTKPLLTLQRAHSLSRA